MSSVPQTNYSVRLHCALKIEKRHWKYFRCFSVRITLKIRQCTLRFEPDRNEITQLQRNFHWCLYLWMASEPPNQQNICGSNNGRKHQSACVSVNDIPQRLSHTCCQDYTSAERQIQCFVGVYGRNWYYDWCARTTSLYRWTNLPSHWHPLNQSFASFHTLLDAWVELSFWFRCNIWRW